MGEAYIIFRACLKCKMLFINSIRIAIASNSRILSAQGRNTSSCLLGKFFFQDPAYSKRWNHDTTKDEHWAGPAYDEYLKNKPKRFTTEGGYYKNLLTRRTAPEIWKQVTSESRASQKSGGRGKRGSNLRRMDLNRGQVIGVGRLPMNFPGLNQNIRDPMSLNSPGKMRDRGNRSRNDLDMLGNNQIAPLPEDPDFKARLVEKQNAQFLMSKKAGKGNIPWNEGGLPISLVDEKLDLPSLSVSKLLRNLKLGS